MGVYIPSLLHSVRDHYSLHSILAESFLSLLYPATPSVPGADIVDIAVIVPSLYYPFENLEVSHLHLVRTLLLIYTAYG